MAKASLKVLSLLAGCDDIEETLDQLFMFHKYTYHCSISIGSYPIFWPGLWKQIFACKVEKMLEEAVLCNVCGINMGLNQVSVESGIDI